MKDTDTYHLMLDATVSSRSREEEEGERELA